MSATATAPAMNQDTNVRTLKPASSPPSTKEEFLKRYPPPKNADQASAFLRAKCRTVLTLEVDHDRIRATLKGTNSEEHKIKFEYSAELATDDKEDYEAVFLECAQKLHSVWAELEIEKYAD